MKRLINYSKGIYTDYLKRKEIRILPSYISFYILLSFIPLLALVLVSFTLINRNNQTLLVILSEIFPQNVYQFIRQFVEYYAVGTSVFTINNLVLLYLASRIYYAIYHSNVIIMKQKSRRNFIYDKSVALVSTLIIILTILILVAILVLGRYLTVYLTNYFLWSAQLTNLLRIGITIGAVFLLSTSIMISLPDYRFNYRKVWRGSIVTALVMIVATIGFQIYVDNFSNYANIYHTFSTILIFILWVYLMSYAIVIGLIVNSSLNK